jgi:hypothetical protein
MQSMFSRKIELKKLANSENFANSEIAPEAFAYSEPGAKFSVFPETVRSSLGSAVTIGVLPSQSFTRQKLFMTSSNECISHPKVSKGKGMSNY